MKAELQKIIDQTMITIHNLNDTKGKEYADEGDALANFKNRAAQLDLDPLKVWGIFFGKYADAIYAYVRNGKVYSEAIEGRIDDAILYLILLKGLIQERANEIGSLAAKPTPPQKCYCTAVTLTEFMESREYANWLHKRDRCLFLEEDA